MSPRALVCLSLLIIGCRATPTPAPKETPLTTPPDAPQVPHNMTHHGDTRTDPYHWMMDRENPEVMAYLKAENAFTDAVMAPTKALQKTLYDEILSRINQTDLSVPFLDGGYWYYSRTVEGKNYRVRCRRKGTMEAPEEILLDENVLAQGHDFFQLGTFDVSPDHTTLAYSVDLKGDERYTTFFKDLKTGKVAEQSIPDTYYSSAWGNDNKTFFYTRVDKANRPFKLFRHKLGTPATEDALVHHETDDAFFLNVGRSRSGKILIMELGSQVSSEVRILDANTPEGTFTVVSPRREGVEYSVTHHDEHLYVTTNDGATNFKLMQAPLSDPGTWTEVLPERPDVTLKYATAFKDHLVLVERSKGLSNLRVRQLSTGAEHEIAFDEPSYGAWLSANAMYNTRTLRFSYTSMTSPESVYDYDMVSKSRTLLKQQEVKGYDRANFVTERVEATAPDGTKIPISLVYKKGARDSGTAPLHLLGYGSYGASYDPYFSTVRLSLVERGVIVAIAHIRGGGDLGRTWYENGKFLHKKNTFTDFIACAEHLVSQGYTEPSKLSAEGGSAGGLLMGAVANMRPDLFSVMIASVPFVDVLTTILNPDLPLTVTEWDEWGNPLKDPAYYNYIKSYSPYDNVTAQNYPTMLVTAGLNDPRVGYWEPAKWVAKLRDTKTDANTLLLKTNLDAGHSGASGRYEAYKEYAFELAFLLRYLNIKP